MYEDRDMTYGELGNLLGRLIELGVAYENDIFMWFIQQPNADFACPFLYTLQASRFEELVKTHIPEAIPENISNIVKTCSVKAVSERIMSGEVGVLDENIGLLDFKDDSRSADEKFGGIVTIAGTIYNSMREKGFVGKIDNKDEIYSAVFGFRLFDEKWIPILAKIPDGRSLTVPDCVKSWLNENGQAFKPGELMKIQLSSMPPDMLEWLETIRNFRFYDGQNAISGS